MASKERQVFKIILLALVIGFIILGGSQLLSIIGSLEEKPSCEFPANGGECIIEITLPENRALTQYSATFAFDGVPEANFKSRTQMTAFASAGPFYEDDSLDSSNGPDLQKNWVYAYRIPQSWAGDVHAVLIESKSSFSLQTNADRADAIAEVLNGMSTQPYPYNTIVVKTDSESPEGAFISNTKSSFSGERRFTTRYVNAGNTIDSYRARIGDFESESGDVFRTAEIIVTPGIEREEIAFYAIASSEEQYVRYATATITIPPTTFMSYKEFVYPNNFDYGINSEFVDSHTGRQKEALQSVDLSEQINDYCERTGLFKNTDECVVPLTFKSSTTGKVILDNEDTILKIVEGSSIPSITGWVTFNFEEEPTNAAITTILIFAVLAVGVVFIPFKKRR